MKDLHTHIEQNNITTTICTNNWHDLWEHTQALKCDLIAGGAWPGWRSCEYPVC